MADIGPLIKLFLFKSLSSALSVLFQIFPEVGESHIALLQEGVIHGERSSHALRFVSLLPASGIRAAWVGSLDEHNSR